MSRIVALSGSSGFIGSRISEVLKEKGDIVLPIPHYLLQRQDLLEFFMKENNPEVIIHCAAYGNMSHQKEDEQIFEANVIGTWNLLEASKHTDYKAFINFGSSSEYGKKQFPMKEEFLPEPETMYGCTKVAATYIARSFAKVYDKPVVTIRPFSVYGKGEADFRFIPTAIKACLYGDELPLEPHANHDWIYIDDLIEGVERVVEHAKTLQGQVVNIGTGRQYENKEIVEMISEMLGKPIKTRQTSLRPYDSSLWIANITTLKLLGWEQQYDIWGGLSECIEYYRKRYYAE